jgi:uncharacterized protein
MKNTAQIADAVLNEIRESDGVLLCVLFGSAARDRMTESSDVDLAVAGAGKFSADHLANLEIRLSRAIGREIDILDLHRLEGLILKKALEAGVVIIKKDRSLYAHFIKKMLFFDADFLPLTRRILKARAGRFAHGK